ncbi:MAG: hypothetical protein FGF52_02325 [Candidatus Brockarchaeota archaeon]|nr:hypothetical protein [Candidatus Brockarchaeota archaeon]
MRSQSFLEKLRDRLNERYKRKFLFEPFEIREPHMNEKWDIDTRWRYGFGVGESADGRIYIDSHPVTNWEIWINEFVLTPIYLPEIKKAKSEEDKKKLWKMFRKKKEEILEDIVNREWKKYLEVEYLTKPHQDFILVR